MKISSVAVLSIFTIASTAWCAPPLATDDASTLAPGMCQLEIEHRQFRNRTERDIAPACNFLFDAEIGVGHLHVAPKDGPHADSVVYQFKKVFAPAVDTARRSDWSARPARNSADRPALVGIAQIRSIHIIAR